MFALALATCVACRTTSSESPAGGRDVSATHSLATRVWQLVIDGEPQGVVTRYESDEQPPRTFFLVRNLARQDLGLVDSLGRAWRYRPHEREAEWVATGTVLQGAVAIVGLAGVGELRELPMNTPDGR